MRLFSSYENYYYFWFFHDIIVHNNKSDTFECSNEYNLPTELRAFEVKQKLQSLMPLIKVEYQSESTIVLKGEEDILISINGTTAPFWEAVDFMKHYGYSLVDVTTSGIGSQGNPTRFYAIMTK